MLYFPAHLERVVTCRVRDIVDLLIDKKSDIVGDPGVINFKIGGREIPMDLEVELRLSVPQGTETNREPSGD